MVGHQKCFDDVAAGIILLWRIPAEAWYEKASSVVEFEEVTNQTIILMLILTLMQVRLAAPSV